MPTGQHERDPLNKPDRVSVKNDDLRVLTEKISRIDLTLSDLRDQAWDALSLLRRMTR